VTGRRPFRRRGRRFPFCPRPPVGGVVVDAGRRKAVPLTTGRGDSDSTWGWCSFSVKHSTCLPSKKKKEKKRLLARDPDRNRIKPCRTRRELGGENSGGNVLGSGKVEWTVLLDKDELGEDVKYAVSVESRICACGERCCCSLLTVRLVLPAGSDATSSSYLFHICF